MFFRKKKAKLQTINETKIQYDFKQEDLNGLIVYFKNNCGIDLENKRTLLFNKFSTFCEEHKIISFTKLLQDAKSDKDLMQEITNIVTINETYFYRELSQLQECIEYVKESKRKMKILCAPCATGEEVYSLAFLAHIANLSSINFEILGIDIDSNAISSAKEAVYSQRSLNRLEPDIINLFFESEEKEYRLKKNKITNVNFKVCNIFDDSFKHLGKFDIIFSRNMMIYFDNEFKLKAIKKFYDALNNEGRLYTGHADLVPNNDYFKRVFKGRTHFYLKEEMK